MTEIKYEKKDKKYYINNLSVKKKNKIYALVALVILVILSCTLIFSSMTKIYTIGNSEVGSVDYTVYLKDNNFYSNRYLRKGDSGVNNYIASLIDTVNVEFTYDSRFTDAIDYVYEYEIDAKILVTDKYDNSKVLYSTDEVLVEKKQFDGLNNNFSIKESLDIDYDKYNSYVSSFKETYSLDVESNLILTMNITQSGSFNDKQISNKGSSLTMTIPLTKSTIDISINTNQLANNFEIPINESVISNRPIFITGIVLFMASIVAITILLLPKGKKNDLYRKEINRILKNYDRLIITSKQPSIDESNYKNKVRVMSFEELLDVNELTNEPIIYYEVEPDEKSYFIILKQDTLYKLTISKKYLEEHKDDKKEPVIETIEDDKKED